MHYLTKLEFSALAFISGLLVTGCQKLEKVKIYNRLVWRFNLQVLPRPRHYI
jgi:hypothetical protein